MKAARNSFSGDSQEIRKVLVRTANWIGDAVMTLPALASIREGLPKRHLAVLTKPWVADLFSNHPMVDEVILYESPGIHEGVRGKWKLARELRQEQFDLAILFQNAFEAAFIAYLAGIPRRAGYNTDARGILLTRAVPVNGMIKKGHQVDYYRAMTAGLGFQSRPSPPSLALTKSQREEGERILDSRGLQRERGLIGLAPGAAYGPAKQWFPERFASLADRLSRDWGARILIFGSQGDRGAASQLIRSARREAADFTGQTTLGQAIGLIARCRLFVTNDSGLMHVAAALGVPVVAIFGSTDPARTGPLGENCRVVRKPLPCAPCLKTHCPEKRECMEKITVDEVYEAAKGLWDRAR
ncbi:MAG: lipopolysaccharide heptosyltransferase II [Deltaproteobacteria bacterium]|nr:lipopolysaccharide heptosyltransferase II [Deltaproteobacteria bacterium]